MNNQAADNTDRELEAIRKEQEQIDGRSRRSADDAFLIEDHIRLGQMARRANLLFLALIFRARALRSDNPERALELIQIAEQDFEKRPEARDSPSRTRNWQFARSFLMTTKARILDTPATRSEALNKCVEALNYACTVLDCSPQFSSSHSGALTNLVARANLLVAQQVNPWKAEELKWLILDPIGAALLCLINIKRDKVTASPLPYLNEQILLQGLCPLNPAVLVASPWLQLTIADYNRERREIAADPRTYYDSVIREALPQKEDLQLPNLSEMLKSIQEGHGENLPRRDRFALYATIQKERLNLISALKQPDPYFRLIYELRTNLDAIAWKRIESVIGWYDDLKKTPGPTKTESEPHSFAACGMLPPADKGHAQYTHTLESQPCCESDDELVVLRSWSSWTPLVGHRAEHPLGARRHSRGGGYLVRWQGIGIAIDPGISFVHNLYEADLTINDVDIILVSHNHPDHTLDIQAVLNLFHVAGKAKHLWVLSENVKERFEGLINSAGGVTRPAAAGDSFKVGDLATIRALVAHHQDNRDTPKKSNSLGFLLDLHRKNAEPSRRLLFTCDTHWCKAVDDAYREVCVEEPVDILVPHLSDVFVDLLVPQKRDANWEDRFRHNHLGLKGTFDAIKAVKPSIAAVGEWGQELEGYRKHIVDAIGKALPPEMSTRVLPADRGLVIDLNTLRIKCSYRPKRYKHDLCRKAVDASAVTVDVVQGEGGEQIRYLCEKHSLI